MPWLRNNEATMTQDMHDIYARANVTVRLETYRSRNPIDGDIFTYICMPFKLSCVPADKQMVRNKFKTVAMPRGLEPADALLQVQNTLNAAKTQYSGTRHITIYNTNSNQAVTQYVTMNLKENDGWAEHDYRTALTCDPFHTVAVMSTKDGLPEGHVVIFTSLITDAFLIKLGAVLPLLYGYTISAGITQAFLEGNKSSFITAFYAEIADLVIARRRAEQEQHFTALEDWLKTADTTRINQDISNKERNIQDFEGRLRQAYIALKQLHMEKASMYWGEADNRVTEFIEYVKQYDLDKITRVLTDYNNDSFAIQLVTELAYWDEEAFRNYLSTTRMNCVTQQNSKTKALLKNIFLDRTVKVIFHTGIRLRFRSGSVERYTDLLREGDSQIGIPHTHIYHHDCWGNNRAPIEKAFADRNYLIAWEQIKATLCGLNLTDATVFEKFCNRYMAGCDTPCLVLKGTEERLSPNQFMRKYPEGWIPTPLAPTDTLTVEVPAPEVTPRARTRRPTIEADADINLNPF